MKLRLLAPVAIAVLASIALGCSQLTGLDFIVTFSEAKNVSAGSSVFERGVPIGKVAAVSLQGDRVAFRVRVDAKYKNRICLESRIAIEDASVEGGAAVSRVLVISTPVGSCTPVVNGQAFEGDQNLIDTLKEVIRNSK